tara:strand:+ start:815 stop:1531 length:717 start_codon:yes stop_codon:yes gene_type:complete
MTSPRIIALVPMKGHSSRVPGKNFKEFAGKPLFQWIIDSLLSVPEISKVVINTDAADQFRAKGLVESERLQLRSRKPELCGDEVSMNKILADDIAALPADIYLMTHSTNPLLTRETIVEALETFKPALSEGKNDSLFSVNKWQTRFYREDASAINHDPDNLIQTQDLEPWYEENSNIYLFNRESFATTNARIGRKPMIFATPRLESSDIDTPADWELAEVIAHWMDLKKERSNKNGNS